LLCRRLAARVFGRYGDTVLAVVGRATLASGGVDGAGDLARIRVDTQARRQAAGGVGQRVAVDVVKGAGRRHTDPAVGISTVLVVNAALRRGGVIDRVNGNG